ncbi:MAG: hypothetical protein QXI84_10715 [Thermofilaceae archaeon]
MKYPVIGSEEQKLIVEIERYWNVPRWIRLETFLIARRLRGYADIESMIYAIIRFLVHKYGYHVQLPPPPPGYREAVSLLISQISTLPTSPVVKLKKKA